VVLLNPLTSVVPSSVRQTVVTVCGSIPGWFPSKEYF